MIDWIAHKSRCGEVSVNAARRHLARHEWATARRLLKTAIEKGALSEPEQARAMLSEVNRRMGISPRSGQEIENDTL